MKLIYGTSNLAKIKAMREMLKETDIEMIGLNELKMSLPKIEEDGKNPLENARKKAFAYHQATGLPVFSCDSGLYFEGLEPELQPGVFVRRINGKELTDEEMISYYSNMARKRGGSLKAQYKNAICLVINSEHIFEDQGEDLSSGYFLLVDTPHKKREKGFPLDSLSVDPSSGCYYYDLEPESEWDFVREEGFRRFFEAALKKYAKTSLKKPV